MHTIPALAATPVLSHGPTVGSPATAAPVAALSAVPEPSPRMRLDPALGLVVLEFRNDQGQVVQTLPSERQLAAYRSDPLRR